MKECIEITAKELADYIYVNSIGVSDVSAIIFYDDLVKVVKDLIKRFDFTPVSLRFESPEWDNYYDEYLLSIISETKELFVEPMVRDGSYINSETIIEYIDVNASKKLGREGRIQVKLIK